MQSVPKTGLLGSINSPELFVPTIYARDQKEVDLLETIELRDGGVLFYDADFLLTDIGNNLVPLHLTP